MRIAAPAKINLALRVYERKPDGYHRVETVMMKTTLADVVDLGVRSGDEISISVPGFPELENESNLAVRAAEAFFRLTHRRHGLSIRIQKKIPVGGGLGGGSSDAAAVLRGLSEWFGGVAARDLTLLAANLGADVPFLLHRANLAFARGIGEKLIPWPSPASRSAVLCHPGFPVSTAEAYAALGRTLTWTHPNGSSFAPRRGPENWRDLGRLMSIGNDLQEVAERKYPVIADIRMKLKSFGAVFSQMSGSGSTVFGIFEDAERARTAVENLKASYWAVLTRTLGKEKAE